MALFSALQKFITKNGQPVEGASVLVTLAGSATAATVYATRDGGAKSNPFPTLADGNALCYVSPGRYDMTVTFNAEQVTFNDVEVGPVSNIGSFAAGGVVTDPDQLVEDAAGNKWRWAGALNYTFAPGEDPELVAGWVKWVDAAGTTDALEQALADGSKALGGVVREFDSVELMQSSTALALGSKARTYSHAVDSVTDWEIVDSDPSPHYGVAVSGGLFAKLVVQPEMDLKQVGASGADNESVGLFLGRLYTSGCRRIVVSNTSIQLGTISLPDALIVGNNCRITSGKITNARLEGVYHLQAGLTEAVSPCQQLSGGVSHKLIHRSADGGSGNINILVVTKSADGNGFIAHSYRDKEGDGEAISAGAPWDLLRSIDVQPVYNCILLKKTFSAQSAAHTLISNIEPAFVPSALSAPMTNSDGTTTSNFIRATNIPPAGWQEYTITCSANNKSARKANIAIYSSAVVSDSFTVTVGGVQVFSGTSARRGTQSAVWTIDFELTNSAVATDTVHTIRVTNNATNGNPLYVVGVNLYRLDEVPNPNTEFDSWKIWRDATNPFINITGASDYAIYDNDLEQFVGSFHGGETSLELKFSVDGQAFDTTTWAAGAFKVGQCFKIQQRTDIVGKLDTYVTTTHHVDGVQAFRASMTGSMICGTFYTMLTPTYREFDYVVHPIYLANGVAGTLQNLGRVPDVVQKRTSTDQYVRTCFTQFDVSNNSRGGVYLDNKEGGTPGSISNRKIYYGPIYDNAALVEQLSFEVQREFGKGKY